MPCSCEPATGREKTARKAHESTQEGEFPPAPDHAPLHHTAVSFPLFKTRITLHLTSVTLHLTPAPDLRVRRTALWRTPERHSPPMCTHTPPVPFIGTLSATNVENHPRACDFHTMVLIDDEDAGCLLFRFGAWCV